MNALILQPASPFDRPPEIAATIRCAETAAPFVDDEFDIFLFERRHFVNVLLPRIKRFADAIGVVAGSMYPLKMRCVMGSSSLDASMETSMFTDGAANAVIPWFNIGRSQRKPLRNSRLFMATLLLVAGRVCRLADYIEAVARASSAFFKASGCRESSKFGGIMHISCISADTSKAGSFGLDRIERSVGEDIERAVIGSPEYELDGALGNFDSA